MVLHKKRPLLVRKKEWASCSPEMFTSYKIVHDNGYLDVWSAFTTTKSSQKEIVRGSGVRNGADKEINAPLGSLTADPFRKNKKDKRKVKKSESTLRKSKETLSGCE